MTLTAAWAILLIYKYFIYNHPPFLVALWNIPTLTFVFIPTLLIGCVVFLGLYLYTTNQQYNAPFIPPSPVQPPPPPPTPKVQASNRTPPINKPKTVMPPAHVVGNPTLDEFEKNLRDLKGNGTTGRQQSN